MQRSSTIAAITAIALGLVAFQYWNASRPPRNEPPLPALVRDLPKDVKGANSAFRARVERRFPVGSSSDAVAKELAGEGFELHATKDRWHSAGLKRNTFVCEIMWWVRWRSDSADKVAETQAHYGLRCP